MKYDLNQLNNSSFEQLVQALSKKILGNSAITFGEGTDGGREATFEGKAPFPNVIDSWEGYWVIQAKFKSITTPSDSKDFSWVKSQIISELDNYSSRKIEVRIPELYLFFTNVVLTAKPNSGGRDKANNLEEELQEKYKIKKIKIISNDDIQDYLNSYRDIAISFAPFILPGDVLYKLLELLNYTTDRAGRINEIISRFLEVEFKEDIQSKLDHAGKLTSDKTNLEKVFIDLYATSDGIVREENKKFISTIIDISNKSVEYEDSTIRYVLIGGPGQGKSTLTQFICQVYRANFLKNIDKYEIKLEEINHFTNDLRELLESTPNWVKMPIKIILKEYAGWINHNQRKDIDSNISVLSYLTNLVNKKSASGDITNEELENIFRSIPCLFIFDGLDEVPASSNRNEVMVQINTFTDVILRRINKDITIIATTRQQGYYKEFNVEKYNELYIADLDNHNCIVYLEKLLDNLVDTQSIREDKINILKKVLENNEISRLMRSPLQASIMAILVINGGEPPRNKFDLFYEYFDIIFRREKQRNISKVLSDYPDYVKDVHNKLGFYLQSISEKDNNPSASIYVDNFKDIVIEYLKNIGLSEAESEIIASEIVKAATERLVFISELEEDKIGFAIRSMQEYFAANNYIHNISDEEIRDRIKLLATNSYWSNTLIFAVGYIVKTKKYLVDFIESMSYELNGSGEDINTLSLSAIVKSGSWLSLNILNEAVFRSYPNYINKFSNLLKPLFYLSPNKLHENINKLPEGIIDKWIYTHIDNTLSENYMNFTSWYILLYTVDTHSSLDVLIKKYWPKSSEDVRALLEFFIKRNFSNKHFIEKITDYIELLDENDIEIFINIDDSVIGKVFDDLQSKDIFCKPLFLFSFLSSLSKNPLHQERDLLSHFKIKVLSNLEEYAPRSFDFISRTKLDIVEGYYYQLLSTKINDNAQYDSLKKFAADKNVQMVNLVVQYLNNQIFPNYCKIYEYLLKIDEKNRVIIKNFLMRSNPILMSSLKIDNCIDELQYSMFYKKFTHIDINILNADEKLEMNEIIYSRTRNSSADHVMLLSFKMNYIDILENENSYIEYFRLFNWIFKDLDQSELDNLKDRIVLLNSYFDSIVICIQKYKKIKFTDLQAMFYFFDIGRINKLFEQYDNFIADDDIVLYNSSLIRYATNLICESIILKKLSEFLKLKIILNENPNFKIFIQQLVIHYEHVQKIDTSYFYINDVLVSSEKSTDEHRALLILFKENISFADYNNFIDIVSIDEDILKKDYYLKIILFILSFANVNEYIDNIIIFLDTYFLRSNVDLRSEYESFVFAYLSSKPTEVSIQDHI